jgi:hypothetical protein
MASYFRGIPNFDYVSRLPDAKISDYITVKNLFKRGKLREDIFGNLQYFTKYKIIGDERPDNVAYKVYGDETLDWVILLSNNILNIQTEWPLPQSAFDKILLERYGSYDNLYNGIHHHETKELKSESGAVLLKEGLIISDTWCDGGNFIQGIQRKITYIEQSFNDNSIYIRLDNPIVGLRVGNTITVSNMYNNNFNGEYEVVQLVFNSDGNISSLVCKNDIARDEILPSLYGTEKMEYIPYKEISEGNLYYYQYFDSTLNQIVNIPSYDFITPVTNYEYEIKIEEDKRNIFVLKQNYLNVILNDVEVNYPYKEGGQQYINEMLKKGENIRLIH